MDEIEQADYRGVRYELSDDYSLEGMRRIRSGVEDVLKKLDSEIHNGVQRIVKNSKVGISCMIGELFPNFQEDRVEVDGVAMIESEGKKAYFDSSVHCWVLGEPVSKQDGLYSPITEKKISF
tara:strand:- start:166 stop:531 length:366 start_codon:yes stop_codon:yes gene_type:complete